MTQAKRADAIAKAKAAFAKKHGITVDQIGDQEWDDYLEEVKLNKVKTREGQKCVFAATPFSMLILVTLS